MQQYYKTTLNMLFCYRNITVFLLKIKKRKYFSDFYIAFESKSLNLQSL